jgi:gamma-glutamyltranspeptidase/glutathione hydrolase
MTTTNATMSIAPGDRPAGNIRGTRSAAVSRNGMIATSQALASAAGLRVLQGGGNAIDAAVTAAAVLAVIEPSMNGIGGDLFAIVYDAGSRQAHGLDSSGRSAYRATPEEFGRRGLAQMPALGPLAVTVPGVVEGWHQLLARFGTIALAEALHPAIAYARDGFPVQQLMAAEWAHAVPKLTADPAAAATFLPCGQPPAEGEIFANPRLAGSLTLIAEQGRDAFYTGDIARALVKDLQARDGLLEMRDFAAHAAEWVRPIRTTYRGYDVLEMPPSTQGCVALQMLNLMETFDLRAMGHNSADYLHVVAEAKQLAFADRAAYLADRATMPADALAMMLSKEYAARRRSEIDMGRAGRYAPGAPGSRSAATPGRDFAGQDLGDTVYLTVADRHGNVVSFIQSLFAAFGAGIVAGETGITLHNRGSGVVLTAGHPNQVAPHKRPLHTLVPAMILKAERPWASFGVMGGDNQAQAHAQVVANLVDFGMSIQQAGEAARVRHTGSTLAVESGIDAGVRQSLEARGHTLSDGRGQMGGFQGIVIDPETGVMMGGSDVRKDGLAIGW